LVDYFAGIFIENSVGKKKKLFLICSLIANIGVLAIFKYYNFFTENLTLLFTKFSYSLPLPILKLLLPIGLSFHTFQAMSYTIEVYRGNQKAERHFGIYSLYVMFYPQLVAGPIERPQNMLPQFHKKISFNYDKMVSGLSLVIWGFFKKLVVADRLAAYVSPVFKNPELHNGTTVLIASFFFAIQIYCDFSGYSDIAIGTARTMGFDLMTNFKRPYFSKSIKEFWGRWHISLSTWFRDYLYIPLGGNKVSKWQLYINLLIVFAISGIWHGANWTFVIWGLLHGIYRIVGLITEKSRKLMMQQFGLVHNHIIQFFEIVFTTILITLTWVFFRANSVQDAFTLLGNLKTFGQTPFGGDGINGMAHCIAGIALLFLVEIKMEYYPAKFNFLQSEFRVIRWGTLSIAIFIILIMGVFNGGQFIYFQF
jgi:D-alanyl-lipoteichoic acid acyltransferase DltB (MBOAT superfamily)